MPSAADLITRSLGLLGVVEATETPGADDLALGLESLNGLIESWGLQRQTMHEVRREVFALTPSTATYTIGTGGAFNTARPLRIERCSVVVDGLEIPIGLPLTLSEIQGLSDRTSTAAWPTAVGYDYAFSAAGLGTITVFPTPTSACSLVLYLPKQGVTQFADASTNYVLPPGWARALRYALALELAPHYARQPDPQVQRQAALALAEIKRANFRLIDATFDPALSGRGGRFDIMAGE